MIFAKMRPRLRQSMFFTSYVCQRFFKGAAAAAAGRGSPPPPRAGVVSIWVYTAERFLWFYNTVINETERAGAGWYQLPSPGPPGPVLRFVSSEMGGLGPGGLGAWGVGASARCGDPFHRSIFITFACLIAFHDPLFFIA